jgi:hypothetical protein
VLHVHHIDVLNAPSLGGFNIRGFNIRDWTAQGLQAIALPAAYHPSRSSLDRLTHEYELKG